MLVHEQRYLFITSAYWLRSINFNKRHVFGMLILTAVLSNSEHDKGLRSTTLRKKTLNTT